jgi:hypothetical protein
MKTKLLKFTLGLALLGAAATAYSQSLLVNGDFENGSLAGWTVANQSGGSGTFGISTPGANTPFSGHSTESNPSGGSYYAVSDQGSAGAHALIQTFTIGSTPESVTLDFQMFVNNWAPVEYVNAPKWFAAVEMIRLAADQDWLHKATKEISKY